MNFRTRISTLTSAVALAFAISCFAIPASAETVTPADYGIVAQDAYWHWSQESDAPVLLDVRTPEEFAGGHIPGAKSIPHDRLADRLADLQASKGEPVVVYCKSGRRAGLAAETLAAAGYTQIFLLEGHWNSWSEAGQPVEK